MKKITITTFLSLFWVSLFSQSYHEVKINTFGLVMSQVGISYEYVKNKKFGVEVGLAYNFEKETLLLHNSTIVPPQMTSVESFDKNFWVFTLHSKFYTSKKDNGSGLNFGGYFHYRSQPNIDASYYTRYEEFYNKPVGFSPEANYIVGGFAGYKLLLFKDKFIIEPTYGIGLSLSNSEFDVGGFGVEMTGFLQINLGFRF
ncbi:MAG: hypothetical protein AAF573_20640 [Bacteroidota bacterium]